MVYTSHKLIVVIVYRLELKVKIVVRCTAIMVKYFTSR